MGWNLTWDYSLIFHPIRFNFSCKISKTKPFHNYPALIHHQRRLLWVWQRCQWKRGIVKLEQSQCSITPTPSWAASKDGILKPKNSTSKPSQQRATTHLRRFQTWLAPFFCYQSYQISYLSPSSPHVFPCGCDYRFLSWAFPYSQYPVSTGRTDNTSCRLFQKSCLSIQPAEMESSSTGRIFFLFVCLF